MLADHINNLHKGNLVRDSPLLIFMGVVTAIDPGMPPPAWDRGSVLFCSDPYHSILLEQE
jgi:hypothetical protein